MLQREVYLAAPGKDSALWCMVHYVDGQLTREETTRTSGESDAYLNFQRRVSYDNGRTWSAPDPMPDVTQQLPGGGIVTYPGSKHFDERLNILYEKRMLRIWPGGKIYTYDRENGQHPFNDHCFAVENGEAKLLRYEEGPDYNPEQPFDSAFCTTNRAYMGTGMTFADDGTAYFPLVCYGRQGDTAWPTVVWC